MEDRKEMWLIRLIRWIRLMTGLQTPEKRRQSRSWGNFLGRQLHLGGMDLLDSG